MPSDLRLPIKVVVVRDEDYRRPESTGGQRKLFGEVTPEIRDMFVHQIEQVGSHFADVFRRAPAVPAVARIVLKEKPENVQSTAVDAEYERARLIGIMSHTKHGPEGHGAEERP